MDLFDAVFYEDVDAVYKNIFDDVDVNAANAAGNQPLHAAAHAGNVKIAEILIRAGAKPSAKGRAGNTPLHYAVKQKHIEMVEMLLHMGADPTIRNGKRFAPRDLCYAMRRDDSKGAGFFVVEAEMPPGDALDTETKKIVDVLDHAIMERSEVLGAPRIVLADFDRGDKPTPGPGSATAARSGSRPESPALPLSAPDAERSRQQEGRAVLDAVKPLIADAKKVRANSGLSMGGSSARSLFPSEERTRPAAARSGSDLLTRLNSLDSTSSALAMGSSDAASSVGSEGGPTSGPWGTGGRGGALSIDAPLSARSRRSSQESSGGMMSPTDAAGRPGYWLEVDGRQVFVKLADSDSASEDSNHHQDGEQEVYYSEQSPKIVGRGAETDTSARDRPTSDRSKDRDPEDQRNEATFSVHLVPTEVGLGMQLMENGRFTRVSALHPDGPATAAQVRCGDILVRVNDCSTDGFTVTAVKSLLAEEVAIHQDIEITFMRPPRPPSPAAT